MFDFIDGEIVVELVNVEQGSRKLDVIWLYDDDGMVYYFIVKGVEWSVKFFFVYLNWDGVVIGSQ